MSAESWPPLEPPIVFSAVRGGEELHVQVIDGQSHPNPSMMYVLLEVRLGPDERERRREVERRLRAE